MIPSNKHFTDENLQPQLASLRTSDEIRASLVRYFTHLKFNTAKTYLQWLRVWNNWYVANAPQNSTWPSVSFPIHEPALLKFIDSQDGKKKRDGEKIRASSINNCVHALNSISKKALNYAPIISADVWFSLKTLANDEARRQVVTGQATPFMLKDLKALIALHGHSTSVRQIRDLCLIWLGFETLLRSAEIRRIKMGHLKMDDQASIFTLTVYRIKTDTSTKLIYHLSPQLTTQLHRLMNMVGRDNISFPGDYLFQAVNAHDNGYMPYKWGLRSRGNNIDALLKHHNMPYRAKNITVNYEDGSRKIDRLADDEGVLSKNTLLRAFESLWQSLNPDPSSTTEPCWTGHSVRVGGAIQLANAGFSTLKIAQMGNWTSDAMVSRYIRNIDAEDKAMTQFIRQALD